MCGLVGMFGEHTMTREKIFLDLLHIDVLRGPHSTGVAFIRVDNSSAIVKDAVAPSVLVDSVDFKKINAYRYKGYIGHNRWATVGAVNQDNSHPFEHEHIIGAHNGTLRQDWHLDDAKKFDVDSEALIYNISKNGIDKTWGNVCGAAALSWFNAKEGSMNLLRNAERPLFFCRSVDEKAVFWASEAWMLRAIFNRHDEKMGKLYELTPNTLVSFIFREYKKKNKDVVQLTEGRRKLTPYVQKAYPSYTHHYNPLTVDKSVRHPWNDDNVSDCFLYGDGYSYDPLEQKPPTVREQPTELFPKALNPKNVPNKTAHVQIKSTTTAKSFIPSSELPFEKQPESGDTVSVYPIKVMAIAGAKGQVEYQIRCGFQNYKGLFATIQIRNTTDRSLLDYIPSFRKSEYSKAFFTGTIGPVVRMKDKPVDFYIPASTVRVIIPRDATRTINGHVLSRDDFNSMCSCVLCSNDSSFETPGVQVSDCGSYTICPSCVKQYPDLSNSVSEQTLINLLSAREGGEVANG